MGMDAVLYAVGYFNQGIAQHLEYSPEFYCDTLEGALVITTVISCHTTSMSKRLAEALNINPWDFNDHVGIPITDDVMGDLVLFIDEFEGVMDDDKLLQLRALKEASFSFVYMPNG